MKKIGLIALVIVVCCCSAWAGDGLFEALFGQYFQRVDAVTIGAGDAKEVNSASEIIDPWPRYVRNKRIPGNGPRMAGAIQRYQDVKKLHDAPQPLAPIYPTTNTSSGATSGAGAASAPTQ